MLKKLKALVAQIDVIPGRIQKNLSRILEAIEEAKKNGCDIVVFPEMATTGYLIGDLYENNVFCEEANEANETIRRASDGIIVIWGGLETDFSQRNEDGRPRKFNAGFVASSGQWAQGGCGQGRIYKSLMPKYRFFDDERHFYSLRKFAQDLSLSEGALIKPFKVEINGQEFLVGVTICEDIWSDDYNLQPAHILAGRGANIVINISASPFTWKKNEKRHRVVRDVIRYCHVPLIYCNCVGLQNNLKNYLSFDGRSTVYSADGQIIREATTFEEDCMVVDISLNGHDQEKYLTPENKSDDQELYDTLNYFAKNIVQRHMPKGKVVVGLSGGIDSAVVAAILVNALGPSRVLGVNLPTQFNSSMTKNLAAELASNLGIEYLVMPIEEPYRQLSWLISAQKFEGGDSELVEQNIQARIRAQVLAAVAQSTDGCFINTSNKTESAFGYCTLGGDMMGAFALIGDCLKREVYQLARYHNQVSDRKIPQGIIDLIPSAELSAKQDITKGLGDPFYYPIDDEIVRALVEFRKDISEILSMYDNDSIDEVFKLPKGTVKEHFPIRKDFCADLEKKWSMYQRSIFKHAVAVPIPVVSRRAFGFDLREAIIQDRVPYISSKFQSQSEI
jgi:NAD+ synthase (glutamine-hydrolysing)